MCASGRSGWISRVASLTLTLTLSLSLARSLARAHRGLPPTDTASRLSILGTVLLTLAAFQLVISASLPSMPNPTYADYYSGCSFLFVFGLMVVVATLGRMYNDQDPDFGSLSVFDDTMLFIASGAVFVFYHLVFIAVGIREFRRDKHVSPHTTHMHTRMLTRTQMCTYAHMASSPHLHSRSLSCPIAQTG
jgi:hypothetical protein